MPQERSPRATGIAYVFGVLGVVLFVQLIPKLMKVDTEAERASFQAANAVTIKPITRKLTKLDPFGAFAFFLAITFGCLIGSIKIPGINFSLGTSGGTLISGLVIGHFGHVLGIDCRISKESLQFFRELGLVMFLIGAGVPGGVSFMENIQLKYFLYGILMTLVPMIIGFLVAKYVFKLRIFNNLGSITGGMTSTPALDALTAPAPRSRGFLRLRGALTIALARRRPRGKNYRHGVLTNKKYQNGENV